MMVSEEYLRNFIEINLNDGKTLSEIKAELMQKNIPDDVIKAALYDAYKDEEKYLQKTQKVQQDKKRINVEKLWWVFVLLILGIISLSVFAIKKYLIE